MPARQMTSAAKPAAVRRNINANVIVANFGVGSSDDEEVVDQQTLLRQVVSLVANQECEPKCSCGIRTISFLFIHISHNDR